MQKNLLKVLGALFLLGIFSLSLEAKPFNFQEILNYSESNQHEISKLNTQIENLDHDYPTKFSLIIEEALDFIGS